MKKMTAFFIVCLVLTSGISAYAVSKEKANMPEEKALQDVLKKIEQSQGVTSYEQIDCTKVTDKQFEELGDAYMSIMHPNKREHEFMDRMMGGEGTQSLELMHRNMGAHYLGCFGYGPDNGYGHGMMGGYGRGMMGGGMMHGGPMCGTQCQPGYGYSSPQQSSHPLDENDAKAKVETYIQSLNNPNLKVGKIKNKDAFFVVEIVTKDGSLVDKIDVNKNTGLMQSVYR